MRFRDRREAGQLLAGELDFPKGDEDVIVLGIPRGGVVVAYEVAQKQSGNEKVLCILFVT